MPIPVPPGALPEAHRVMCLRAVRAIARGKTVGYKFESASSAKCAYCTLLKEKCRPVPAYVGPEFESLLETMAELEAAEEGGEDAAEEGGEDEEEEGEEDAAAEEGEEDTGAGPVAVRRAAYKLASCVQVATAQFKDLSSVEVMTASHYALLEEVKALRKEVSEVKGVVASFPIDFLLPTSRHVNISIG